MPEDAPAAGSSSGKLSRWIRENKTLAIGAAVGGIYFIYEYEKKKQAASGEGTEETAEDGSGTLLVQGPAIGQSEGGEGPYAGQSQLEALEKQVQELEGENKREHEPQETVPASPGTETPTGTPETGSSGGVSVHGREFPGATSSRIVKTGTTVGGKPYVEYAIQYPGRIEYWQYFTDTGNWRMQHDTGTGPASGKAPKARRRPHHREPSGGISDNRPVSGPGAQTVQSQHPNAVRTANRCINGGVGAHKAPAGYHLFCGADGWIYRAPNH